MAREGGKERERFLKIGEKPRTKKASSTKRGEETGNNDQVKKRKLKELSEKRARKGEMERRHAEDHPSVTVMETLRGSPSSA